MKKDIEKAIKAEQEYINTFDSNELSLVERLTPFGYDNLDDYFHDKIKYNIIQEKIDIQYDKMEPTIDKLYEAFNSGIPSAFSVKEDYNRTWLWAGRDNMLINTAKVNELNLGIRSFQYNGGPIITCNDDFNLAIILPKSIDLDIQAVLEEVINLLESKGHEVIQDNNDLLVNDKKVLGSIVCSNDKAMLYAFELSLTNLEDLVKTISLKESTKQPGYIDNIKREEVEEVFDKWLHSI